MMNNTIRTLIAAAFFAAFFTFIFDYLGFQLTGKKSILILDISPPHQQDGEDKIFQFVNIINDGDVLAKDIHLVLNRMKGRIYEDQPKCEGYPLVRANCGELYDATGNLTLSCGDLQPKGQIACPLSYKGPELNGKDINVFADNVKVKKIIRERASGFYSVRSGHR